ncbi:MAG: nucleotide sugar dehydrogenase [Calditrichaeota bacterium]|nr:nucleotide sugar dehydrogenase [Calditrichota bacterium]
MNISVFGLGYVGCVSAACFAEMGHKVIGVDVKSSKVKMINKGISPIVEKDIDVLIKRQVDEGNLSATQNTTKAIRDSDVIFICVGTPSNSNGSIDFSYVDRVCGQIGRALKYKKSYTSVVLRSTVLPGIPEKIAIARLEENSGKKAGKDFGFALNPEFLRESTSVYDFYHPPKTVIGELDEKTADILEKMYRPIDDKIFRIGIGEASMIKYSDNAFHAIKVAFANEIGRICKEYNIDSRKVMQVFTSDVKLNLSPYYLKPGFAFGGSCLPKDLRAITHEAKQKDIAVPLLDAAMESNMEHIHHALDMVQKNGRKRIGVLGLSFKGGTDDLRESPIVNMVEQLIGKGYKIRIYDKNVSMARLIGSNKDYIKRYIPHIAKLMSDSVQDVLDHSDVVIVGNQAREHEAILGDLKNGHKIIDLTGLDNANNGNLKEVDYEGICW